MSRCDDVLTNGFAVSVWQPVGDDAGVVSVRSEGRSGSGSAVLSRAGPAPQVAAGLPVC